MDLARRALDAIHRQALLPRGGRVVVAVSGGADSVALLRLLRELETAGELTVAGVAHLNHGLRETAHRDEQFTRALAADLDVPFRSDLVDVRGRAHTLSVSLEDAGRRARYELFERVATELNADAVATGHTRDDQAETFLLRLIRGAGPRGLGGLHPRVHLSPDASDARVSSATDALDRVTVPIDARDAEMGLPADAPKASRCVIRPLLDIGRDELRTYLATIGQTFVEDESNGDISIPRNRIRHTLIPALERDFSPGIVDVLAREAAIARQDEEHLQKEAIDLLDSIVLDRSSRPHRGPQGFQPDSHASAIETVELKARALCALPPAVRTRVAQRALAILAGARFVGYDDIDRLVALAEGTGPGASVSLPGQHACWHGEVIVLSRQPFAAFANSFRVSLSIPGEAEVGEWVVSASRAGQGAEAPGVAEGQGANGGRDLNVTVRADRLTSPLTVRSRRPGDRLKPAGLGGREKKLQDVLVDRKVPRHQRDFLPLVVDSADTIVWVVGEPVAEDFRVTGPSQGVIFLKARRLGGQG
jgi:tRNA(Ile)-lysidine synthase